MFSTLFLHITLIHLGSIARELLNQDDRQTEHLSLLLGFSTGE